MSGTRAIVLATNVNASAVQPQQTWNGGRAALNIVATVYGTTVSFQQLGADGVTWLNMNASTIAANAAPVLYDCPAGQYRLSITGGTTTALYATLVSVPYV